MDTKQFFDFVFVGILSMRFHPNNTAVGMSEENMRAEIELARRAAIYALFVRAQTLKEVDLWPGSEV